jgi:hypothetical protein
MSAFRADHVHRKSHVAAFRTLVPIRGMLISSGYLLRLKLGDILLETIFVHGTRRCRGREFRDSHGLMGWRGL